MALTTRSDVRPATLLRISSNCASSAFSCRKRDMESSLGAASGAAWAVAHTSRRRHNHLDMGREITTPCCQGYYNSP